MNDKADRIVLHITTAAEWDAARGAGEYRAPSLETEGFIHLSTPAQLLVPANERYAGRSDLVILLIDPSRLGSRLVFEDSYRTGVAFPHVYGAIEIEAVTGTVAFPCRDDGSFALPPGIEP